MRVSVPGKFVTATTAPRQSTVHDLTDGACELSDCPRVDVSVTVPLDKGVSDLSRPQQCSVAIGD